MKNRIDDSCGCALGAKFMAAGLLMASAYYGSQFFANELSLTAVFLRVFVVTFLAGGAGKTIGILRYRLKVKGILSSSSALLTRSFLQKDQ
jgi:hypothetical protein